jgi:hypothetical protein
MLAGERIVDELAATHPFRSEEVLDRHDTEATGSQRILGVQVDLKVPRGQQQRHVILTDGHPASRSKSDTCTT